MKDSDPQDWTNIWKQPTITSFPQIFPNNYDGSILEFWQRQLDGDFHHIVDIACGNGALTWVSNDILNCGSQKTNITGVDFADISPFKVLHRKKRNFPVIRFIGNTPAENLPFEDQSTDLVISQYGLEYTNLDKSIPEIARILVPTGRMSFILHDEESAIITGAMARLNDAKLVLHDIAIHDIALQLNALCLRIKSPELRKKSSEHQKLVTKINSSGNKVRDLVRNYPPSSPIHMYMERLNQALDFSRNNKNINRKELIIQARDGLHSYIERIEDLEGAALSAEDRRHLTSLIEREGFTITEKGTLSYKNNDNIGSILVAQR